MNNKNLTIINIALAVVALVLVYLVYRSISEPVVFENTRKEREIQVVQSLKDIRSTQILFKQTYNRYTGSFDSLIEYVKTGELPVVNIVADPNDTTFTKTINDTVGYVKVIDSLFSKREGFDINSLRVVPFSQGEEFELQAGYIKRGGLKVAVFEAKTPYMTYLWDLDHQRVNNLRAEQEDLEKYAGLKVGSMDEASTNGNWESL
ncbi:MAG: hypothetical protein IKU05_00590 [Bacteroidales bacterium]|nr:hypothetical protein [Bacteroidales bacterium]